MGSVLDQRIDLEASGLTASELSTLLAERTGATVAIVAHDMTEQLWLDVKAMPLRELLLQLAQSGVAGVLSGERSAIDSASSHGLKARRLSLVAQDTTYAALAQFVPEISAGRVTFAPRVPEEAVNSQIKDFPFGQWLEQLAGVGEVVLDGQRLVVPVP